LQNYQTLLLTKVLMAGKSGYALFEELRENYPDTRDIPFLFLTALDHRKDKHAIVDLHPTAYITKPVDITSLTAVPLTFPRHSGAGRNPVVSTTYWIPAVRRFGQVRYDDVELTGQQ